MQYREALHIPADLLCTIRDDMVKQVGTCCVQVVPAPILFANHVPKPADECNPVRQRTLAPTDAAKYGR